MVTTGRIFFQVTLLECWHWKNQENKRIRGRLFCRFAVWDCSELTQNPLFPLNSFLKVSLKGYSTQQYVRPLHKFSPRDRPAAESPPDWDCCTSAATALQGSPLCQALHGSLSAPTPPAPLSAQRQLLLPHRCCSWVHFPIHLHENLSLFPGKLT